jgi:hypothetical protein
MRRLGSMAVLLFVLVLAPAARAGGADPFTYAVIGDTPYGSAQLANFPKDVALINADPDVSWVIHVGDIKNSTTPCTDAYFAQIRADFDAFADPLVYTPGDNEWTDCHLAVNGGYVPTERLAKVRSVFFDRPGVTLGRPALVLPEGLDFRENVLWARSGVVFSSVDITGANNDLVPWFGAPAISPEQQQEYDTRLAADLAWIDVTFAAARIAHAPAVVIATQADLTNDEVGHSGFTPLVERLTRRARDFGKPVLLLNGDSHDFRLDQPFVAPLAALYPTAVEAPNLTRITVQGSTRVPHEWLKLRVEPGAAAPFSWTRIPFVYGP